jgi:CHAD domain-containing protein
MTTSSSAPVAVGTARSSTSKHLEVERKFEVLDSTVTPSFDGLGVVASVHRCSPVTLDAVYFDTPGGDLATHHLTLRRRTGGADAGWHLKLPAGPDARTEIRMPLDIGGAGGGEVPEALRDVARAIVRDQPLAPVARITTSRTVEVLCAADGTALAEFCDDQVTASVNGRPTEQHWREWELELAEGAVATGIADEALLQRLSGQLHQAGAQPARSASKLAHALGAKATGQPPGAGGDDAVHRAVAEQLAQLLVWDRAVRADVQDSVHEMRVTIRTIRSLLQASAPAFGLSKDAWVLDELRALATVLGVARDAEVLAERYQRTLDELPAPLVRGPVRRRLVEGARQQYRSGWGKSLSTMRSERYFTLLDALEALVAAPPLVSPLGERRAQRATIKAGYERMGTRARVAAEVEPQHRDAALHSLRKGAKRLRYTAAAAGANKVSEAAKAVQTVLGDHQDSVVSRTHLIEQVGDAHQAGEDTFTYGVLYEREATLAQRCEQQLDGALHTLDKAVRKALRR